MITKRKKKTTTVVDYETEWKHGYLDKNNYLYFTAKTPIEDIIPLLENRLNQFYPDLNESYKNTRAVFGFSRLYRNLIPNFKEWQVLYRKPGSDTDYHIISERIGYKARRPKKSLRQTALKNYMLWTHELYPLIDRVKIKGASSCQTIARRLNHETSNPNYQLVLKNLKPHFQNLWNSYKKLDKKSVNDFDFPKDLTCQKFCDDLEVINKDFELINFFMNRNYQVLGYNITDILQPERNVKTTKGWRVEFLDN